ncbi:hypothetical protein MSG28_013831 [Choristoneura fumiferana]|uniref:Uncharacterized protein n=1 Tax=Choristoneura fumiferana TaxID=7141 RepID=A0ACC0K931_CHOFU|nr:hypothetical protein MSG28_013831 [Choristoneura fumiferana]
MKSEKETTKKGHTYVQWAAGIIANSIAFTYAMQACWISPVAKVLQSKSSPTGAPLSDSTLGWVASALPITAFVFVPIFSFLADKYGRKTSILIMAVPQTLYFASTTSLVIARVCSGIAAGGCFNVVPMYNKEISQDNMRGAMGSLLIVACNMGILIIFALGAYVEYYTVLYIVAGIPVLTFILMLKGLDEDDKSIQNEVNEMKKDDEFYKTMPPLSMIASGVDLDAELMTLTFPAVMLAGSFLAMVAMERVGRKGWGLSFALLAAFAPITAAFGMYANFYFFAAVQLLGFAAVLVLMPETRGKSIEQLETELKIK